MIIVIKNIFLMLFLELLSEIIIDNTLGLAIIVVVIIDKDVTFA